MVAAAAPPIAVAGEALIALSTALAWAITIGLLFAWNATFHRLLTNIAAAFDDRHLPGTFGHGPSLGVIGDAIRGFDSVVIRALSFAAKESGKAVAYLLNQVWAQVEATGKFLADYAHTMEGVNRRIQKLLIPRAENAAVARAHRFAAPIARDTAFISTVALPRIRAREDTITDRVGQLGDVFHGLRAKVRAHEKLLVGAGVAALGLRILNRVGLRYLRCGNVRGNLRRFCGLDPRVLDAFLLGATVLALPIGLESMTRALVKAEAEFVETLFGGVSELKRIPKADRERILRNLERGLAKL